jgi:hypothetical protein
MEEEAHETMITQMRRCPFTLILAASFVSTCPYFASAFSLLGWNRPCQPKDTVSMLFQKQEDVDGGSMNSIENDNPGDDDALLGTTMDSFLRGDYDQAFAEDAPAPHPGLSPRATIEAVLRSLRDLNDPSPSHGAAVLQRFCAPLSRGERWGSAQSGPWKEVLRGAITPTMLARRIRASQFSVLLDWTKLDVTDGYSMQKAGVPTVAFVNAALFFRDGVEPAIVQFTLQRWGGVWLIDTARMSEKELFMQESDEG